MKIGRYPLDIFEGFWKIFFLYFLPLVLIAQIPSQALMKALSPESVVLSFAAAGLFLFFALRFWRWGLTHYHSAST
jgi:ABC-2 type transport system permease protein